MIFSDNVAISVSQLCQFALVPTGYLAEVLGDSGNAFDFF
jgi:hypothetical protein